MDTYTWDAEDYANYYKLCLYSIYIPLTPGGLNAKKNKIVGFFLVTVILFFLGLILSIPAIIIDVLLLLDVAQRDAFKEENSAMV